MNLKDLDNKKHAHRALKENFEVELNVSKLNNLKTRTMLSKVASLIKESRQSADFYKKQNEPAFMKLVFMEQALKDHLRGMSSAKIVVENQEVEKSQVILAAQDMVDTLQKMYEDANDMLVKELPALVNSIQSEIGVNESNDFNSKSNSALTALNAALQEARTEMQSALGVITGEDVAPFDQESGDDLDLDLDAEGDDLDLDLDLDSELDMPPEPLDDPEDLDDLGGGAGRERR